MSRSKDSAKVTALCERRGGTGLHFIRIKKHNIHFPFSQQTGFLRGLN